MTIPKILKSEVRYRGRVFDLVVDDIEYPSGNTSIREVARHNGGSVIVPLFENGDVMLVRQYRHPVKQYVLELPAGKLELNEDPLVCAQRELREETGYEAGTWKKLISIFTTPGFCSEVLHIFLASGLHALPSGQALEEGELTLTIERYPLAKALEMIQNAEIVDGKTIFGLFLAAGAAADVI